MGLASLLLIGYFVFRPPKSEHSKTRKLTVHCRVVSPDSLVDAVSIFYSDVWPDETFEDVYLVPHGSQDIDTDPPVFRAERTAPVKLRWKGDGLLEIGVDRAQIEIFKNYWWWTRPQGSSYVVELQLERLDSVSTLPTTFFDTQPRMR